MKLLYGRINQDDVLYRFTAKLKEGSKLSYNEVRSGHIHFRKVAKITRSHHEIAANWVGGKIEERPYKKDGTRKVETIYHPGTVKLDQPVELWFAWRFKSKNKKGHNRMKALDSGNCQAMSKGIEDGLVRCGVMDNDTNSYVTWVANLSVPQTEKERMAMTHDEVELYICSTSANGKEKGKRGD